MQFEHLGGTSMNQWPLTKDLISPSSLYSLVIVLKNPLHKKTVCTEELN
jgi:hypothetical protein